MGKYRWSMAAVVICSAAAAMAQEAAPLPTAALLKSQVEAGEYRPALQGLTRVLALKGPAAEPYDRLEMLLLRAECQLQLRAAAPALEALTQAQKEAVTRGDADKLGEVSAMMLLIQRSPAMRYTPKQSTGPLAKKPIEILDRGTRKEAYKALFEDELAAARPKVRGAETATRLPPVLEAAKVAGSLRGLEQAATGGEAASKEMTDNLARHAALLVENAVSDMSLKTETIAGRANTVVTSPILHRDPATNQARLVDMSHRRGLDGQETQALQTIDRDCAQVVTVAGDLALALPSQASAFKSSAAAATSLRAKVAAVLNDNYGEMAPVPITPNLPVRPGGVIVR
jgi:hypothetical protein